MSLMSLWAFVSYCEENAEKDNAEKLDVVCSFRNRKLASAYHPKKLALKRARAGAGCFGPERKILKKHKKLWMLSCFVMRNRRSRSAVNNRYTRKALRSSSKVLITLTPWLPAASANTRPVVASPSIA